MRYFLLLVSIFFIISGCDDPAQTQHSCSDNSGCETGEVCFYGSCFEEGNRAMGVKTIQIVGGARLDLVDGDIAPLRIQVVLSGTEEMKEVFSDEDLKRIVGPISNETIDFKFTQTDIESELSQAQIVTDEFGMGSIDLSAKNSKSQPAEFNISVSTLNCSKAGVCNKSFIVEVGKRSKTLSLVTNETFLLYTGSHKILMARVTTNNGLPFPDQDVNFKIDGVTAGSTLGEDTNIGSDVTIKTDYAGIARISLNAGDSATGFVVDVSTADTIKKTFNVTIKERNGGCLTQADCESLGEAYQCQNEVCVYVPIPCDNDLDCSEGFECKDNPSGEGSKICVEKPYVCGDAENPDIASCRCVTDLNCPEELTCVRGRCIAQDISCDENIDCPNGLICREGVCQPNHTECKMDLNCFNFYGPDAENPEDRRCLTEEACVCREGLCVNPCPDTNYIELSGGSGASCTPQTEESDCSDNEVCFNAHGISKCIAKWDANYYFHLIEALPPTLQTILNGIGRLLGPISDILVGEDIDWGLPGWLSWLEETIVAAVNPLIDQYIPAWAQNLVIGLNDTIEILQEMKVKVKMSFIHDPVQHSIVKGIESWESFYIEWNGSWTEVKPQDGEEGFQLNSSTFTGSIVCQLEDGNPSYSLYIDEHSAEFYFGRFVTAFLDGVLIPAVTSGQANSLGEAVELYVDCHSIAETVVDTAINIVGDWASGFITVSVVEGLCHTGVNLLVDKVNDYIDQLHFGDAQGGSDAFKFGGYAKIETVRETEGKKLKEGVYTGTLDLGGERSFTADWDAEKAR